MNKEQKAAVVDRVAYQIKESDAIFAVDYRGISVKQAMELRAQLSEAGARFQIVKNRLTVRAADKAGAESLKELLEGPTAFAFVHGDAAPAAKAIATFRRQSGLLEFKGGTMEGETLSVEQIESIARLPARDVLQGQFVGVLASPLTTLVRGLGSLISGLAIQLRQIEEQGQVAGEAEAAEPAPEPEAAEEEAVAEEEPAPEAEASADEEAPSQEPATEEESEAPGDPAPEAEAAEEETSEAPSEGGQTEPEEG